MNQIIRQALSDVQVSSRLEPVGLLRSDERRPDGVSLIPGKFLVWGATCFDLFAQSYRSLATHLHGTVAERAEKLKSDEYKDLPCDYMFMLQRLRPTHNAISEGPREDQ